MAVGDAYTVWLDRMEAGNKKVVVIECGAGLVIPSARCDAENIAERFGTTLVRINPIDDMALHPSPVGVGIPLGSADALRRIWKQLEEHEKEGGRDARGVNSSVKEGGR